MSSEIKVDTISEKTSANGVVIDGVTLKDSKIGGTITIPGSTGTMALTSDISAGGLTGLQQFRLTANYVGSAGYITSNWEENDTDYEALGSYISESSGVFSFSSTGKYLIHTMAMMYSTGYNNVQTHIDSGDGTFTNRARASGTGSSHENGASSQLFIDVTSTDFKVKVYSSNNNSGTTVYGDTDYNKTAITFMRISDT